MAALRCRVLSGRLTTCFFKQATTAGISTLTSGSTRQRYVVQKSYVQLVKGSRGSLVQALLGCHNNGRVFLVSAMAVRHNSSQTTDAVPSSASETVPIINSSAGIPNAASEAASEAVSVSCAESPLLEYSSTSLSGPEPASECCVEHSSASLASSESASACCVEYSSASLSASESDSLTCAECPLGYSSASLTTPESSSLTCSESPLEYSSASLSAPESASVFAAESPLETAPLSVAESSPEYANVLSASESATESAPLSAAESTPVHDPSPVVIQPVTEQVTEAPVLAMDVLQEAATEVSLSELGLGSYTPVGLIQNLLEFMHVSIGMPWWSAIVVGTIIARCAVFPVIVKGQREAAKLNNVMPEMTKLTSRMNEAKQSGNKFDFSKAYSDMMMFQKKHDVNPLRGFLVPLVQAPIFISFFIALRKMSYAPVPSMQTGGLWWFADLTAADPYFILPLAVTGTMFAILELGAESGVDNPNLKAMKTVFRIMPFVILPMTINFPTAIFTYWMTSNLFSLGQVALLRHPAVRSKLNIPLRITHAPSALPPNEGLIESVRKGWKNAQLAHQLQERERRINNHLDIAAKGPLRQTFAHNPLQQSAASMSTGKSTNPKQVQQQKGGKKRPWEETIG